MQTSQLLPAGLSLIVTAFSPSYDYFAYDVAIDSEDNVLVCGTTPGMSISGGWDTDHGGGTNDGFLVKLTSDGEHYWSTYVGGSANDYGRDVTVDAEDNVFVAGYAAAAFGISGGWDPTHNGNFDGFVVKLSPTGRYRWGTYLGGSSLDYLYEIELDAAETLELLDAMADDPDCRESWRHLRAFDRQLDPMVQPADKALPRQRRISTLRGGY